TPRAALDRERPSDSRASPIIRCSPLYRCAQSARVEGTTRARPESRPSGGAVRRCPGDGSETRSSRGAGRPPEHPAVEPDRQACPQESRRQEEPVRRPGVTGQLESGGRLQLPEERRGEKAPDDAADEADPRKTEHRQRPPPGDPSHPVDLAWTPC